MKMNTWLLLGAGVAALYLLGKKSSGAGVKGLDALGDKKQAKQRFKQLMQRAKTGCEQYSGLWYSQHCFVPLSGEDMAVLINTGSVPNVLNSYSTPVL